MPWAMGIETIYQDLALAENLNTPANIFLGREKMKKALGFINVLDHQYMQAESRKILEKLDILIPSLRNRIRALSGGQRQAVAISRSIYWDAKFLIMDEPTAALGVAEQKKVIETINLLKSQGIGIIVISHQMHDIFQVADRMIIMRRGEKVAELVTKETNADEVVSLIVGAETVTQSQRGTRLQMKLFRKTFLFFIGVIVFQAALTILLVTNVTRRANLADARKELEDEASVLYDGFNGWKRQIWKSLIDIANDRQIAAQDPVDQDRSLKDLLLTTKVDTLALKNARGSVSDLVQISPGILVISDVQGLVNNREHPYIELARISGTLCLVGVTSLSAPGSLRSDVFLLKRIDRDFCSQLTLNRKSSVVVLLGAAVLASSLAPEHRPLLLRSRRACGAPTGSSTISAWAGRHSTWRSKSSGGSTRGSKRVSSSSEHFSPTTATTRSCSSWTRTILWVSLAGALLTLVLSIFLSRNITHPIAELLAAMGRIRDGALDTQVRSRGGYEIARFSGASTTWRASSPRIGPPSTGRCRRPCS